MDFLLGLVSSQPAIRSGSAVKAAHDEDGAPSPDRGAHCKRIFSLLQQTVQPDWHAIPDPTSEEWLARFRLRVAQRKPLTVGSVEDGALATPNTEIADITRTQGEGVQNGKGGAFEDFSSQEEFLLLNKIASRIDTPWVQALRRLRAIEECEASRPLEMTQVINYAKRLAGSVAAPPETTNIVDVVAHQSAFPAYHFLPYPSMEELQNSRLAALGAKPYADVCFPPEVTAKVVYLRRDTAFGVIETQFGTAPCFETSLVPDNIWRDTDEPEMFYVLQFTSATPCCTFWFALANGLLPISQPLPSERPMSQLPSLKPLLVPGPFPKTVRVQCRKQGKKHSRITQTSLKLKGKGAIPAASAVPALLSGQRKAASSEHPEAEGTATANEAAGLPRAATAAVPSARAEVQPFGASQFHGLMLGASRRRGRQRPQESSSESSSGSSSDKSD